MPLRKVHELTLLVWFAGAIDDGAIDEQDTKDIRQQGKEKEGQGIAKGCASERERSAGSH